MLADAEPIDVTALEDRRQAWITALSLSGPRARDENEKLRSVVEAAQRAGRTARPISALRCSSSRPREVGGWTRAPRSDRRSPQQRASSGTRTISRVIFLSSIAPEDHVDELLSQLTERARSAEPSTGNDARRCGTAALWLGALDLAVGFFSASLAGLRKDGRLGLLARSLTIRAFTSVHLGVLETVSSDLDEGGRLGTETRQPFYLATADVSHAIYLAFRGDIDGAEARIRDVERVTLGAQAHGVLAETRHARGVIDLAAGRHDEAYEQLRRLFDPTIPRTTPRSGVGPFRTSQTPRP